MKLSGVEVIKDLFEMIAKQYEEGWAKRPDSLSKEQFLEKLRKDTYKHQFSAPQKTQLNKKQIQEQARFDFEKCVFVIYASIDGAWIYMHSYFNPAAANMENPEITINEDGWITHPKYPLLRMGVFR